jgi:hypothetical protein
VDLSTDLDTDAGSGGAPRPCGAGRLVWFLTSHPQRQVREVKNQTRWWDGGRGGEWRCVGLRVVGMWSAELWGLVVVGCVRRGLAGGAAWRGGSYAGLWWCVALPVGSRSVCVAVATGSRLMRSASRYRPGGRSVAGRLRNCVVLAIGDHVASERFDCLGHVDEAYVPACVVRRSQLGE